MARSTDELVGLFDLEVIEDFLFRGRQPATSLQRVFGGQVLGQALHAAARTVGERPVHSLHAYFLLPGDPAVPIVYDVEVLRDGRSFTSRRVAARQHGRKIFYLTASFQEPEPGLEHADPAPAVAPPQDCPPLADALEQTRGRAAARAIAEEFAALEVRHAGASARPDGVHATTARVWMRAQGPLGDDDLLHRALLAYMSDLTLLYASLVPHSPVLGGRKVQLASLDHAMWFHRPFRADEWLLYDQISPSASGARGLSIGRIFDAAGTLVATAVQEGLVRAGRLPADRADG
jgi:acyl-CoA thioesterase II